MIVNSFQINGTLTKREHRLVEYLEAEEDIKEIIRSVGDVMVSVLIIPGPFLWAILQAAFFFGNPRLWWVIPTAYLSVAVVGSLYCAVIYAMWMWRSHRVNKLLMNGRIQHADNDHSYDEYDL